MQRSLMRLNLYGRETVRHELKNGLKTQKMHVLSVLNLMSDSLTALFPSKLVNIYRIARIFQNFDDYPGFQKNFWCAYTFATQCMIFNHGKVDTYYQILFEKNFFMA